MSQQRQRGRRNGDLRAEVNRLSQLVANMSAGSRSRSRGRSRNRSRSRANTPVSAPAATTQMVSRGTRNRPRRGPNTNSLNSSGTIRLTNRELFTSLSLDPTTYTKSSWGGSLLINANEGTHFLSKIGALFGRMRWLSIDFEYESMVSSATDGVIAYGLDWSCSEVTAGPDATTLAKATALNPSISHALWNSNVRLPRAPSGRLNARTWYDIGSSTGEISSLASFYYFISTTKPATAKTFGAIWISYTVEFQGPHL